MPRRKRHDPDDAPIDGVYRNDHVVGKKPGWRYYLLNDEDAMVKVAQGARLTERGPDAAHPFYDRGSDGDSGYRVRDLRQFEMPEALAAKIDAQPVAECARTLATIKREARRSPGGEFEETNV